jgi:hypothetical protein
LAVTFFLFFACIAEAQSTQDSTLLNSYLVQVRKQIAEQNYAGANNTLKKIFAIKTTLPDEVAFRYGQAQLGLNNYVKAKEAFQKYITITDNKGVFVKEAEALIIESEKGICKKCNNSGWEVIIDSCTICKGTGKIKVTCNNCNGKTKQYCEVCKGQGVVLKNGAMGTIYQNCQKCNGKGIVSCTVCQGTGMREVFCEKCKGKGYFSQTVICDHKKH